MDLIKTHWINFRDSLKKGLETANEADLKKAWESEAERTEFYTSKLLRKLAIDLGLDFTTELFKVDFAICARSTSCRKVPLIFIESENNARSATHEMWKLCSLSSPLKVLISCTEWCEDPEYWPSGGEKSRLLEEWKTIIKAHNEIWPQPCVYGIIIGAWKGNILRFYSVGLGANGSDLDPHAVLVERSISC